ncbi:hypothetical protein IFM89_012695 [Coptis chinensis]|uniref:Transcription factor BREVIS RADIX N-terminal domain-containing protein n=1 Tax=Coptis chinensis TaxID=261450 RepID=A0A835IVV4_9MAGN|nr:hypothetical protein IFM89_012695 [Coptis chinensis]
MLTCIACTKQIGGGGLIHKPAEEEDEPNAKHAIKTLTSQIKDMALKASGAYRHCKPCSSGSSNNHHKHNYADSEALSVSERFHYSYRRTGSSNSTPKLWGKEIESRLKEAWHWVCSKCQALPKLLESSGSS